MGDFKMGKSQEKHKVRINTPLKRRGSSKPPISSIIRGVGSGLLKVFTFLSVLSIISLAFVMLYNYLLTSPYMKLEHVDICGVDDTTKNELIQMCGLNLERGLLSLKLESLKNRMEKHPWVRTAIVERRFPHTLIVEVEKQEPVAMILLNQLFYMNRWGRLFKPVSPEEEMNFPIVTGLSETDPNQSEKLNQIVHVLKVLEVEEGHWSPENLSEIHLNKNGEISLYFKHIRASISISWKTLGRNMEGLKQVTKHLSQSGKIDLVTQIDLNHEDGAVVSFKKNQV